MIVLIAKAMIESDVALAVIGNKIPSAIPIQIHNHQTTIYIPIKTTQSKGTSNSILPS